MPRRSRASGDNDALLRAINRPQPRMTKSSQNYNFVFLAFLAPVLLAIAFAITINPKGAAMFVGKIIEALASIAR